MKKIMLNWSLSHTTDLAKAPKDRIPAEVPGAVQLDYAKAFNYADYNYGVNFRQFDWMEDEYFIYESTLDFSADQDTAATLCFMGIDYAYEIFIDGKSRVKGEGAFTPVYIDVTEYSGKKAALKVIIDPIPKCTPRSYSIHLDRHQARESCKPDSCYGWDWHPRLVPSGIWGEVFIELCKADSPKAIEASYRLADDLSSVNISCEVTAYKPCTLNAELIAPDGNVVCSKRFDVDGSCKADFTLTLDAPLLWFPRGYGEQPLYTLRVSGSESIERRIGFRRSKLVENPGAAAVAQAVSPKGPIFAPITLEINGKRIFGQGSNWVNTEIFPCLMTPKRYDELLNCVCEANMNILRMWGGQYINHEHFYDRCDELGILIWQEFMLSCNRYPDKDHYLGVLKQEATTLIKRLRTHPALAFWCGGNELFNSWSGLTLQSHPLRLLDSLCYELDRFTPFNMTAPLHGMAHGPYQKVQFTEEAHKNEDFELGQESYCAIKESHSTAYTEFGSCAASPKEYLLKYIMDEETYADCNEANEVWREHHAFGVSPSYWIGYSDVTFFFGGYDGVDDLIDKSLYLQDLCYKSIFEEARRQAPYCSMAINWDFNEPWPTAAGNNLISWPCEPKSCFYKVKEALRPTLLSLEMPCNRYLTGDRFEGNVWILNDTDNEAVARSAKVYLISDGKKTLLCDASTPNAAARANGKGSAVAFDITSDISERFSVSVECEDAPELNSCYDFVHNKVFKQHKDAQVEGIKDLSSSFFE